jgi:hypothetical protein
MSQELFLLDAEGKVLGTLHVRVAGDLEGEVEVALRALSPGLALAEDVAQPPQWASLQHDQTHGYFAVRSDQTPPGASFAGPIGVPATLTAVETVPQKWYEFKTGQTLPAVGATLAFAAHLRGQYAGVHLRQVLEVRDAAQPVQGGPWYSKLRLDADLPSEVDIDEILNYLAP